MMVVMAIAATVFDFVAVGFVLGFTVAYTITIEKIIDRKRLCVTYQYEYDSFIYMLTEGQRNKIIEFSSFNGVSEFLIQY